MIHMRKKFSSGVFEVESQCWLILGLEGPLSEGGGVGWLSLDARG